MTTNAAATIHARSNLNSDRAACDINLARKDGHNLAVNPLDATCKRCHRSTEFKAARDVAAARGEAPAQAAKAKAPKERALESNAAAEAEAMEKAPKAKAAPAPKAAPKRATKAKAKAESAPAPTAEEKPKHFNTRRAERRRELAAEEAAKTKKAETTPEAPAAPAARKGRPSIAEKAGKAHEQSSMFAVRLPVSEHDAVRKLCAAHGISATEWLRAIIRKEAGIA